MNSISRFKVKETAQAYLNGGVKGKSLYATEQVLRALEQELGMEFKYFLRDNVVSTTEDGRKFVSLFGVGLPVVYRKLTFRKITVYYLGGEKKSFDKILDFVWENDSIRVSVYGQDEPTIIPAIGATGIREEKHIWFHRHSENIEKAVQQARATYSTLGERFEYFKTLVTEQYNEQEIWERLK